MVLLAVAAGWGRGLPISTSISCGDCGGGCGGVLGASSRLKLTGFQDMGSLRENRAGFGTAGCCCCPSFNMVIVEAVDS